MGNWRVTWLVGALLSPLAVSEASACDASGWQSGGEYECLEISRSDHNDQLEIQNTCAEPLEVTAVDCTGFCPEDMPLDPGEEKPFDLPIDAAHDDSFRLTSNRNDSITYTYVLNDCPSEKGCNLSGAGSSSSGWLNALLVAGWLVRRQRRCQLRSGKSVPIDTHVTKSSSNRSRRA